jgi:hypothetical protein
VNNLLKGAAVTIAAAGALAAGAGGAFAGSSAAGAANHSPGVASGNAIQVPVHVPVNACGISVDVIGALNPAFGNHCANNG